MLRHSSSQGGRVFRFSPTLEVFFYSMMRQLVVPMVTSNSDLDSLLDTIGVPLLFVEPLKLLLRQPSLLEEQNT